MSITTAARGRISLDQYKYLMNRLRSTRVAQRKLGNKNFSYLESWDVRAHLIRIFGFGNFDAEVVDQQFLGVHEYMSGGNEPKPMIESMWRVTFRLVVRDPDGNEIARYTESAVGSATKGKDGAGVGDMHDNAVKSATSDALKRCAINLGTQFGLSLYDNGNTNDVIRQTLVIPDGFTEPDVDQAAKDTLASSLGATEVTPTGESSNEGHAEEPPQ